MPVYKDKNKGTWFVVMRYTDWKGDRKTTTKRGFKTQRDAKKYESDFMDKNLNSIDMKFEQFAEIYLDSMKKRIRENTFLTKKYIFDKKITPYFKNLKLSDITPSDVINWQNEIIELETKNNKAFSQTYLKTIHNQLSALFNYAVKFYGLKINMGL